MAIIIPPDFADLLTYEKKAYAHLALVLTDGTPHVSPVWFEWDGEHIVVNTARGRVKDKILSRHPNVAVCITDPADPERYMQLRGRVVVETEDGAWEKICDLSEKYRGHRNFKRVPGQVRVTYKILPERVYAE